MAGYWNQPEQTAAAMLDGGWYRTGDLGHLDDDGYLYLVDRAKDMIVTGGENVYCTEVEDALYTHPGVLEATVFGIPDEQWGEAVHAVVVPRSDADAVDRRGADRALPRADRRLQGAQVDHVPDRPAAQVRTRQGAQARRSGPRSGKATPARSTDHHNFSSVFRRHG